MLLFLLFPPSSFFSFFIDSLCDHRRCYYYYWFVATHCVCDEFFSHFVSFRFRNVCQYFVPWRRRQFKKKRRNTHTPFTYIRRRYRKSALPDSRKSALTECIRLTSTCVRKKNSYSRLCFKTAYGIRAIRGPWCLVYACALSTPNIHMGTRKYSDTQSFVPLVLSLLLQQQSTRLKVEKYLHVYWSVCLEAQQFDRPTDDCHF